MPNEQTNLSSNEANQLAHVAAKPPPFWKTNTIPWLVQLEAQFSLAHVTTDETKFNHIIASVDFYILCSVSDVITRPLEINKYDVLKTGSIELHSENESTRIRTLLQWLALGDQRPSQSLMRMRTLGGDSVGEALLKSLWLDRLPTGTQSVLAALSIDLTEYASTPDKIHSLIFSLYD